MASNSPTLHTFDWSLTQRRIVMLVPNFGRGHLFRAAFEHFGTRLPSDHYLVLVANDGIDEDFSDLAERNVAFLTLRRTDASPRNGARLRNAVIKRCRSDWIFQRDPEILFGEDVLARCVANAGPAYRVGQVSLLDRATTDLLCMSTRGSGRSTTATERVGVGGRPPSSPHTATIHDIRLATPSPPPLLDSLSWRAVDPNASTFLHFGFGAQTSLLQSIRGYDEAFTHYGYEDVDLFERLREAGTRPAIDVEARAAHLWHAPLPVGTGSVKDDAVAMRSVYLEHKAMGLVRNAEGWGEG